MWAGRSSSVDWLVMEPADVSAVWNSSASGGASSDSSPLDADVRATAAAAAVAAAAAAVDGGTPVSPSRFVSVNMPCWGDVKAQRHARDHVFINVPLPRTSAAPNKRGLLMATPRTEGFR